MSKAAKKRSHDKKMRAKRAMKTARRTAYAALRGISKKSKKLRGRNKVGKFTNKHRHLITFCGNPGCKRCFPQFVKRRLDES